MVKYAFLSAMVLGATWSSVGLCSTNHGDPFGPDDRDTARSPSPAPDIAQIGIVFQLDAPELAELRAFLKNHNSIRIKVGAKVGTGIYAYPATEAAQSIYKREREDEEEEKPTFKSMAEIPGC